MTVHPLVVTGGLVGLAALAYKYAGSEASADEPEDDRVPIVLTPGGPPRDPGSKLPTEPTPPTTPGPEIPDADVPPNLFIVESMATEPAIAASALSQGSSHEGVLIVIFRTGANGIIGPELMIAASEFPDVTFLAYPEHISSLLNAQAIVPYTCQPNDLVSVQAFATELTPAGPAWGEAQVYCVSSANAMELRAALSTGAASVL